MTQPKPVVQHTPNLTPDQLVSITQYARAGLGPPLAVGRAAVSAEMLRESDEKDVKGKAVHVLHTWKDALWEMGASAKMDVPGVREWPVQTEAEGEEQEQSGGEAEDESESKDDEQLASDMADLELPSSKNLESDRDRDPSTSAGPASATLSPEGMSNVSSYHSPANPPQTYHPAFAAPSSRPSKPLSLHLHHPPSQ